MTYKKGYFIVFISFIVITLVCSLFTYRPINIFVPLDETLFVPILCGGLFSVAAFFVYIGTKSGYIGKMSDDKAVHLLLEKDKKRAFRKGLIILEIGWLYVLHYEIISIIFIFKNLEKTFYHLDGSIVEVNRMLEVYFRLGTTLVIIIVFLIVYFIFKQYQKQITYWKIYLSEIKPFSNEQERMEVLAKEVKPLKMKEIIAKFISVMHFDSSLVKEYLIKEYNEELEEAKEAALKKINLENERNKNIEKLEQLRGGIDWNEYNG